jgi:ribosomal protein L16 Arg81 hydroxylase
MHGRIERVHHALHSQGFAPHYDNVDMFILQLEGYKQWRVYAPMNKLETLPRSSSRDYTKKEMEDKEVSMDVTLGLGTCCTCPVDGFTRPRR